MNFNESPEFKKDVKTLSKKVRTIKSDLMPVYALIEQLYVPGGDERLKNIDHCFLMVSEPQFYTSHRHMK